MTTFVLVHGAWQTARTWDLVTPKLRAAGHVVTTPPLSGLENDLNRLSSETTLQTHVDDVVVAIVRENLQNITLVGHSYAGMIITGVAEYLSDRLSRLVYVDALIPGDGQSALNLLPEAIGEMYRRDADSVGDGWRLPALETQLDMWGLKPGPARDFARARLSDFSIRCFDERIKLPTNAAARLLRTFIAGVADGYPARQVFQPFGDRAKREGWTYHELPTGHVCHVEMPDAFVSLLTGERSSATV